MVYFDLKDILLVWISVIAVYISNDVFELLGFTHATDIWIKWIVMGIFSFVIVGILSEIGERISNR